MKPATLRIMSEDETVDAAILGRSLARFGDGELRLASGHGASKSQKQVPGIALELQAILRGDTEALPCIPNFDSPSPNRVNWATYEERYRKYFTAPGIYGSSFITRPDSAPWIDRPDYWHKMQMLWFGQNITLVTGEPDGSSKMYGVGVGAKSVRKITAPRQHAYAAIDRIEEEIGKPSGPVILCLGATATCLAHRLARKSVHALDLGHVGMFMKRGMRTANPDDVASPAYRALLKKRYESPGWGASGASHVTEVDMWARKLGASSILDYGCGRGTLKKVMPTWEVREYDPGIVGKDTLPEPADLVVATDVLEHIEPTLLPNVLRHLRALALKGMFLVIATGPAKEVLPDGRNAHLIQKPDGWWLTQLHEHGIKPVRTERRKGLFVWVKAHGED